MGGRAGRGADRILAPSPHPPTPLRDAGPSFSHEGRRDRAAPYTVASATSMTPSISTKKLNTEIAHTTTVFSPAPRRLEP